MNACNLSGVRVTGGELFDEIVAREYYSETDARCEMYMYIHVIHVPWNECKDVSVRASLTIGYREWVSEMRVNGDSSFFTIYIYNVYIYITICIYFCSKKNLQCNRR